MKNTLLFLKDLATHNDREWFTANKKRFEAASKEVETLVGEIITKAAKWDKSLEGVQAKDCMFRIYRDVRFSKDKSPYKTAMGALIGPEGRKSTSAINYLHIEPGKSFVAGGAYMPDGPKIRAIRQEIDYNLEEFEKILGQKDFKAYFKSLEEGEHKGKMVPKGYAKDNPAVEYLKFKSIIATRYFTDKEVESVNFKELVLEGLKLVQPLNAFLNRAMSATA